MRSVIVTALGAAALAGCSGHAASTPGMPPEAAAVTTKPPGPAALGATQTGTSDGSTVTATVYHARTVRSHADAVEPSKTFFGIDIRVCLKAAPGAITVSQAPWAIDYADETSQDTPISEYWDGEFSMPLYPLERRLVVGQCVRGWIMYKPFKSKPVRVSYAAGGTGLPQFWRIP
jgi:hypothetical protein